MVVKKIGWTLQISMYKNKDHPNMLLIFDINSYIQLDIRIYVQLHFCHESNYY